MNNQIYIITSYNRLEPWTKEISCVFKNKERAFQFIKEMNGNDIIYECKLMDIIE